MLCHSIWIGVNANDTFATRTPGPDQRNKGNRSEMEQREPKEPKEPEKHSMAGRRRRAIMSNRSYPFDPL